ncbi:cyclophilin71 [Dorcoceras hygrometricum]|uniref:Cyclophilin71 n=1 Tax=Dorcoceras hygrometricum TaxID=472368 RepID=A0A2Z7AZD9_9LAMI|nr:cyclophilin71 [Dorcoceras hygrometricum]
MSSSLISNTNQVYFAYVLAMDNASLDFPVFTSDTDRMFETGSESEDELEMSASKQPSQISESENRVVESASATYLVEEPIEETEQNQGTEIADAVPTADVKISDDESMTIEEHLSMIPDGSSLPSTTGEITKIQFGKSITIRGVNEGDWRLIQNEILTQIAYVDTLPTVSYFFKLFRKIWVDVCIEAAEFFLFGKLLPVGSLNFCKDLTVIEPAQHFSYRRPTVTTWGPDTVVDQSLLISTAPTATVFTESFAQLRDSISQISINQVRTQRSLDDLKSELLFKINNLAKSSAEARDHRLNTFSILLRMLADKTELKAMLYFRAQAQENHLNLSTKLGFLVDYTNRGGDDKNGEGGSSRPQPPPDDQSRPSGGSGSRGSGGDGSSQRRGSGGSSKKRHSNSSGGVHHSSGGGGPVGPIRRDAEYWIYGKRQF